MLYSPKPFTIELIAVSGKDASEVVWTKDIRGLSYPAPTVEFVGPFTILETCPDSGLHIDKYFE